MTKKDIYNAGFMRGYNCASWQDMPELGKTYWTESDGRIEVETKADAEAVFMDACSQAEAGSRDYSPFEFTAKDLNELAETKPYDVWQVFEEGIYKGFVKSWKGRSKRYY